VLHHFSAIRLGKSKKMTEPAIIRTCLLFAFFVLAARAFPAERTAFSIAAGLTTQIGINGCIWMSSAIGSQDRMLPLAIVVSTALMGVFAAFLFLSRTGRQLCRKAT